MTTIYRLVRRPKTHSWCLAQSNHLKGILTCTLLDVSSTTKLFMAILNLFWLEEQATLKSKHKLLLIAFAAL